MTWKHIRLRMGRRDIGSAPLWSKKLISPLADRARLLLCALPGSGAFVRRPQWIYEAIMTQSIVPDKTKTTQTLYKVVVD